MLISITGTPGTGKTLVAKALAKQLNAKLIDIKELIEKGKIKYTYDSKRKTKEITERDLKRAVEKSIEKGKTNIIEGHLSHLVKADYVFVLRTNPPALCRRLEKRRWRESKIKENVLAEFIDQISAEALQKHKSRVFEIDTSTKTTKATAQLIKNILNSYSMQKRYRAGKIDWTENYKGIILKL